MCIVNISCSTICVIRVMNKQTNKEKNGSLSINEKCNMDLIKIS